MTMSINLTFFIIVKSYFFGVAPEDGTEFYLSFSFSAGQPKSKPAERNILKKEPSAPVNNGKIHRKNEKLGPRKHLENKIKTCINPIGFWSNKRNFFIKKEHLFF